MLQRKIDYFFSKEVLDSQQKGVQSIISSLISPTLTLASFCVSCLVMFDSATPWTVAHQSPLSTEFPGKNTRVGSHFLLQGIFLTQELNPGPLHCRQILYHLGHQGSLDTCIHSFIHFSRSVVSDSLRLHESQHTRPPCPSPTPRGSLRLTSKESVMPSSHLILCRPLLLLPPIPPSIRVFSNESTLRMR